LCFVNNYIERVTNHIGTGRNGMNGPQIISRCHLAALDISDGRFGRFTR
jgi:hypothetical protein